jgi:L-fuconolactonase
MIMGIIDSHAHIWIHDQEYPWATDDPDIPPYNALPDDLIALMKRNNVAQTILVQYIKYKWDNTYVAHVMKKYPTFFKGVCRIDPESPGGIDQLSFWTEEHGFKGVRISPLADARGDWFEGPLMLPLFQRAAALKVPIIVLTVPSRLPDLAKIVEKVPEVDVIVDHLADFLNKNNGDLKNLLALARYPKVYLKVSHIAITSGEGFPWQDTHDLIKEVFEVYGTQRVIWGSDWPFCLNTNTYGESISYIHDELKFLTQEDKEWVLGKTALQIWPLEESR